MLRNILENTAQPLTTKNDQAQGVSRDRTEEHSPGGSAGAGDSPAFSLSRLQHLAQSVSDPQ